MAKIVGAIASSHTERDMLRLCAWRELIHDCVSFFMLEKLGAVIGVSNPHIYAARRGESLEEFQKTRNAQMLYSTGTKVSSKN
jgi:gallate dioxygenase